MNHVDMKRIAFQAGEQKSKGPESGFVLSMVKEIQGGQCG